MDIFTRPLHYVKVVPGSLCDAECAFLLSLIYHWSAPPWLALGQHVACLHSDLLNWSCLFYLNCFFFKLVILPVFCFSVELSSFSLSETLNVNLTVMSFGPFKTRGKKKDPDSQRTLNHPVEAYNLHAVRYIANPDSHFLFHWHG